MTLVGSFLVRIFCVILCTLCSPNRLDFVNHQCDRVFPISMTMARPLCSWILPNLTVYTNFNDNYFPVMPTIMLLCTVGISLPVQSGQVLIFTSAHNSFYVQPMCISTATRGKKISVWVSRLPPTTPYPSPKAGSAASTTYTNAYSFSNCSLNIYLHEEIEILTLHSLLLCFLHLPSPNALNLCTLPCTYLRHVHIYLTLF